MMMTNDSMIGRRGELLAELFLQELNPLFLSRSTGPDFGIDFFVGLKNRRGGMNLVAVEVKSTELEVSDRFQMSRRTYDLLANSKIPGLLLVVNVKENRFYHRQLTPLKADKRRTILVPVTEVTKSTQHLLVENLSQ